MKKIYQKPTIEVTALSSTEDIVTGEVSATLNTLKFNVGKENDVNLSTVVTY